MKSWHCFAHAVGVAVALSAHAGLAHSAQYKFEFLANPDALAATQDASLDVLHTVVVDTAKLPAINGSELSRTANWFNGGITATVTHGGKTVNLNGGFDPSASSPLLTGCCDQGGFLNLTPYGSSTWFYSLEYAPGNPFIDDNQLPYDPFVYGFLFVYQNQTAFADFRQLWRSGSVAGLESYRVPAVPEPQTMGLAFVGLVVAGLMSRRRLHG